jgi:hypothetical protein
LTNFSSVVNKFCIYKKIPPDVIYGLPYHEFQDLIEEWKDEMKQRDEQHKKQQQQQEQEQSAARKQSQMSMPKMPSGFK